MNGAAMEWTPRGSSRLRSLPRRLTAGITAFALLVQAVSPGFAQSVTPDAAAGANRPGTSTARNGVPIVDIVRPNASGLSHNKYTDFNVDNRGLILNNSASAGRSVLGGMILANPNLSGGAQARVILNEVTSSNRSLLQGYQEVFGGRADLILANPNGITCDGCGFINTPRATLTTGTPVLDPTTRALMGFDVNRGVIDVAALGLDASTVDYFDIVSRSVQINGAIHGRDVGVFAGRNSFDYLARTVTAHATDASGKPEFGIDSSMLGGMYAGKIKLVGTEKGVGVRAPSTMSASAGGMTITADGRLVMRGRVTAKQRIVAKSTASRIDVDGTVFAEGGVDLEARGAVSIAANSAVASSGSVRIASLDSSVNAGTSAALFAGFDAATTTLANPGTLNLSAGTAIVAGEALLASGGSLDLSARQIDFRRAIASDQPNVIAAAGLSLAAEDVLSTNARLEAAGPVTLASAGDLTVTDGLFLASQALTLEAAGALGSSATLISDQAITLTSTGGTISNAGTIETLGNVTLTGAGTVRNETAGMIAANGVAALTSTGADIVNAGGISTAGGVIADAATAIDNTGTITGDAGAALTAGENITNAGTVESRSRLALAAGGTVTNQAGGVLNGGAGPLTIGADAITNAGALGSQGDVVLAATSAIQNEGLIIAGGHVGLLTDGALNNIMADILVGGDLLVRGLNDGTRAAEFRNTSGLIEAGGSIAVSADAFFNEAPEPVITEPPDPSPSVRNTGFVRSGNTRRRTITTTRVTTEQAALSTPAQLLAGGDMYLDFGTGTNAYSQIAATGDIAITGGTLTNTGRDLIERTSVIRRVTTQRRRCTRRILGICIRRRWRPESDQTFAPAVSTRTIGAVYATIEAGGTLSTNLSGYLDNDATRGDTGNAVGLTSGSFADAAGSAGVGGSSLTPDALVNGQINNLVQRDQLFTTNPGPDSAFLFETRTAFIDPSLFFGSDYFLLQAGFSPDALTKRLGDAYFEDRLVLEQIFALTGKRYLDGHTLDLDQIKQLYANALAEQRVLNLSPGVALSAAQAAQLTRDIVWLEPVTVAGQTVLAPRVYLANAQARGFQLASARLSGTNVAMLVGGGVSNSGAITARERLDIVTPGSIANIGGFLFGTDVAITAADTFGNISGEVSGTRVTINATDIINSTFITRDSGGKSGTFQDRLNQIGKIIASERLTLRATEDILSEGGVFGSGGDLSMIAGGSIIVTAIAEEMSREDSGKGWFDRESGVTHTPGKVYSGANLLMAAGDQLGLAGVDIEAAEDVTLLAQNGITLDSVTDTYQREAEAGSHPNGCMFACHGRSGFEPYGKNSYDLARRAGIRLREDVLLDASSAFIRAVLDRSIRAVRDGDVRVGVFGFSNSARWLSKPTSNQSSAMRSVSTFPEKDRDDTLADVAFPWVERQARGESGSRNRTFVIVTDGVTGGKSRNFTWSELDTKLCQSLKDNGADVFVLEVKYEDLSGDSFYDTYVSRFDRKISPALEACASPGQHMQASTPDEISAAFRDIAQSINRAFTRLVN